MTSIKHDILTYLIQAEGQPVSGQWLADTLGVSRTAIWKQLQILQQEGYEMESTRKGYLLVKTPGKLHESAVAPLLETKRLGRTWHHFDEVESTQLIAHDLVRKGTADGTVVIAELQTAGRGRMLRPWDSAEGKGIWMTVILRPDVLPYQAPQFTLVAAVAVVQAIKALYPALETNIKWPNDLLINGKKCTGILTEMIADPDRIQALLIGIGINVNQQLHEFPEELQSIATSLAIELKEKVDRAALLAKILGYLEHYGDYYVKYGFAPIKTLWEQSSTTIGQQVRATTVREVIEGKAIAITESGVLEIQTATGEIKSVYSADVEII